MFPKIILIGASTGGPGHLEKIFRALPDGFGVPIVVAQHINASFLPTLCESLSAGGNLPVRMAHEGVAIGSGGYLTHRESNRFEVRSNLAFLGHSACDGHAPSVDELFLSALALAQQGVAVLSVVLTGIGDDGAQGLLALRQAGARTIAESQKSAIVYGMPRAAWELGAVQQVAELDGIIGEIVGFAR